MKAKQSILVVDDDLAHRTMLRTLLTSWGYDVSEADDGDGAVRAVHQRPFDLVLMDIRMVRMSGIEALVEIKQYNPSLPVVLMTAYASVDTAVEAMKKGAYDYVTKPLQFEELRLTLARAMERRRLETENLVLRRGEAFDDRGIIGRSAALNRVLETVALVAPSEATVLITGESGTGKEMIAEAIHFNSPRSGGPFVKINCAAITETLLESELFGHEKGSFTGADRRKEGKFRLADGGTLFLDEVSEMSLAMQVKLLRVLQEREIVRVGGEGAIKVDVRVIAATNRVLAREIQTGRFREDLYYRLNVVTVEMPPLRERAGDVPLLARHFLTTFTEKNNKAIAGFTPRAMDKLLRHSWPGNVRELMNAVERAVVLARSAQLDEPDLTLASVVEAPAAPVALPSLPLEEVEKQTILRILEEANGNKSEAARRLGITRRTLHLKLKRYGMM